MSANVLAVQRQIEMLRQFAFKYETASAIVLNITSRVENGDFSWGLLRTNQLELECLLEKLAREEFCDSTTGTS